MRLKKVVKRIVALGTGATMLLGTLGATMAAADLANYPAPFIKDGAFSGMLVIGDKAAAEDVVGVSDIAVSLQFAATKTTSTSTTGTGTTVSGDVFKIEASGDDLNIMQPLSDVKDVLDKNSLSALADGSISNDKGTYAYNQYLTLGNSTVMFVVSDESDVVEDPALYLKIKSDGNTDSIEDGSETFRYKLSFPTSAKSDIDTSRDLDDFDNKKLTILGKEYAITNTDFTTAGVLTIEMMGGAVQDTMQEGETKTYTINGVDYEVTVTTITDTAPFKVKFVINGETTDSLETTGTFTLADKTLIGIKELLPNEAGDVTADVVEFYLGANKLKLEDSNASSSNADGTLTVGSNDVTDGSADLVWSNTSGNGVLSLSTIQIAWQSGDDYYVPIGGKLSEHVTVDQDIVDLLDALNVDFEFAGMSASNTDFIKIAPSGSTNVKLTYTNKNGDKTSEELWWYDGSTRVILGKDSSRNLSTTEDGCGDSKTYVDVNLLDNVSMRYDEDFFVVETNKYSHLMQIKKLSSSDSTITLKDSGTGQTETVSVASGGQATLYKDGYEYTLTVDGDYAHANMTKIAGDTSDTGHTSSADCIADLWTQYGAKIRLLNNMTVIMEEPTNGKADSGLAPDADNINVTIAISSGKLTPSTVVSSSLEYDGSTIAGTISLDSDDNKQEAYTRWGTFIEQDTSGDQDTIEITYPEKELLANVYITSGVTTQLGGTTAGTESVTIQRIEVGATKLASEVADVTAQNTIIVGGPCANAAAATVMGSPADCAAGFTAGSGKINLYEDTTAGTVAMLVAGYTAADTRAATGVVANYGDYTLTGTTMEVTTATSTVKEVTATAADTTTDDTTTE